MPWKVKADHRCPVTRPYAVVRADTNEMVACHETRGQAEAHTRALYANVEEPTARADTKPYGDVTYADPGYQKDGVKRYPLDSEAHVRAAWSYINMPRNSRQYSAEQLAAIKGRIKSAAKKFGIQISEEENRGAVYSYADIAFAERRR